MQARAVPVRPRPPPQATSTRSAAVRAQASANTSLARTRSLGSRKSGQRSHRDSHAGGGGSLPRRWTAKPGAGPEGSGLRNPRPRTSRPEGRRRTPGASSGQVPVIRPTVLSAAPGRPSPGPDPTWPREAVVAPGSWADHSSFCLDTDRPYGDPVTGAPASPTKPWTGTRRSSPRAGGCAGRRAAGSPRRPSPTGSRPAPGPCPGPRRPPAPRGVCSRPVSRSRVRGRASTVRGAHVSGSFRCRSWAGRRRTPGRAP